MLTWAVEGCLKWQAEGLGFPECVKASTDAYRNESDPLANFFEDCVKLAGWAWTSNSNLRAAYNQHCEENGVKFQVSLRRLTDRLTDFGAVSKKAGRGARLARRNRSK